jgi:hypothetical protein
MFLRKHFFEGDNVWRERMVFQRGNAVCRDGIDTQVTLAGEVRMLRIAVQDVSR